MKKKSELEGSFLFTLIESKEDTVSIELLELSSTSGQIKPHSYTFKKLASWDERFSKSIRLALDELGIEAPSQIQSIFLPLIVGEPYKNFIMQVGDHNERMLAFTLGSILRVSPASDDIQVVVLCKMYEDAVRMFKAYQNVLKYTKDVKASLVLPGSPKIATGHIIVGPMKTLLIRMDRNKRKFNKLKALFMVEEVLEDKDALKVALLVNKKTNLDKQIVTIASCHSKYENAKELMKEAVIVKIPIYGVALRGIEHFYINCEGISKFQMTLDICSRVSEVKTLIYCNTRQYAEDLYNFMSSNGVKASLLTGTMNKGEKHAMIKMFDTDEVNVLVSSNIKIEYHNTILLAINLDIPNHIDCPKEADRDAYLHRVGTRGKYGTNKIVLTIVEDDTDTALIEDITSYYGQEIERTTLEKLVYQVRKLQRMKE